jgi:hypothetical protein
VLRTVPKLRGTVLASSNDDGSFRSMTSRPRITLRCSPSSSAPLVSWNVERRIRWASFENFFAVSV